MTMDSLNELFVAIQIIIPISAVLRIIINIHETVIDDDQKPTLMKRNKNIIVFVVISECVVSIINTLYKYLYF